MENEPEIDALINLSDSKDDLTDSPHVNMTNVHKENIQTMLDDAKKQNPKIISLMHHGYEFENLALMTDEELDFLLEEKVKELKKISEKKYKNT